MKSILFVTALTFSLSSLAGPATKQRCTGIDSVSGQNSSYNIIFADHAPEYGYTRQEVEVIRIGSERLRNNVFDLTTPGFATCKGKSSKRLSYLRSGMTRFTATCNGENLYSITAACKYVGF
ncbi:MAG: hypothetical protein V4598_01335 [Bdellovibrionota bacterium]